MPRFEAVGAVVHDRELGVVVSDYSGLVVLTEAGKRQAQSEATALNSIQCPDCQDDPGCHTPVECVKGGEHQKSSQASSR